MYFTRALGRNLNTRHWNRRIWEVGYRGDVLPQQKATGRPDLPVSANRVNILRERLAREKSVMDLLTSPYTSAEAEMVFLNNNEGVGSLDDLRKKRNNYYEAKRMPGKEKLMEGSKAVVRRRGNIGNSLHQHSTIEDALSALSLRKRWD